MSFSTLLALIAGIAYLTSAGLLGYGLARGGSARGWGQLLAWLAVLVHGAKLTLILPVEGGLDFQFFHAMSTVGWLMAAILSLLALVRPVISMGAALFPVIALTALSTMMPAQAVLLGYSDWPLDLHIALALLAYSVLGVAAVIAIGLAYQEHKLRHRSAGALLNRLPPLQSSERMLFQAITAGFLLLTATLISGWLFMDDMFAQSLAHKTVLSSISWLVFGVLLWGRWRRGWRGRTAIRFTLAGMAFLILAYFGSKLVLELVLQRPV